MTMPSYMLDALEIDDDHALLSVGCTGVDDDYALGPLGCPGDR